jgi:hypothetical protein
MLSRPENSGWKPAPSSSSDDTRPCTRTSPVVGSVMPVRSFSSVDLPAPFSPMMPTVAAVRDVEVDVAQRPELAWSCQPRQEELDARCERLRYRDSTSRRRARRSPCRVAESATSIAVSHQRRSGKRGLWRMEEAPTRGRAARGRRRAEAAGAHGSGQRAVHEDLAGSRRSASLIGFQAGSQPYPRVADHALG